MVRIEHFKQLWKTCLRQLWLEEVIHHRSGEIQTMAIAANSGRLSEDEVERNENNWHELEFTQKLQASLNKWAHKSNGLKFDSIEKRQFSQEIYGLLGNIALKTEVVEQVMIRFIASETTSPVILFRKLEDFYRRWCDGEFIDAAPDDNLPQQQMLQLQAQNVAIGLRKVDINTGLNVIILLLGLHRIVRQQNSPLEASITFYPSEKPDSENFFTSRLLRVINYSDSIEIGNFSNVVGEFLQNAQLQGVYLGDVNLTNANFSNANLSGAYLGDTNLTGLQAKKVNLSNANLGDANLSGADLRETNLTYSDLTHCNLSGADLSGADLSGADLGDANLAGANLAGANLAGANLTSASLRDSILSGANLKNAILFGANLSDSSLIGVEMSYADLCRADLSGANIRGSTLKGTNLSDSILFSTNLTEALLLAADLSYAKLNGANLHKANLHKAIIFGADLSDVNLNQVILNEADLSGATINEANLSGADLRNAILLGSDLSYANLYNADLSGSNLSGAILSGADLSYANFSYAILGDTDLSQANLANMTWNENLEWKQVRGLDKAVNIPAALKEKLRLD